jgi:hypothetical protein
VVPFNDNDRRVLCELLCGANNEMTNKVQKNIGSGRCERRIFFSSLSKAWPSAKSPGSLLDGTGSEAGTK